MWLCYVDEYNAIILRWHMRWIWKSKCTLQCHYSSMDNLFISIVHRNHPRQRTLIQVSFYRQLLFCRSIKILPSIVIESISFFPLACKWLFILYIKIICSFSIHPIVYPFLFQIFYLTIMENTWFSTFILVLFAMLATQLGKVERPDTNVLKVGHRLFVSQSP